MSKPLIAIITFAIVAGFHQFMMFRLSSVMVDAMEAERDYQKQRVLVCGKGD